MADPKKPKRGINFGTGDQSRLRKGYEMPEITPRTTPPDVLNQLFERMTGPEFREIEADRLALATENEEALNDIARRYGGTVRGSEGYGGLFQSRNELMDLYNAGGLTDVTRAGLEASRREEDQWIRAQREAQLADLAERGMAGGGAELLGSIADRASAADRMSARDLETRAFAQEQALQALQDATGLSRDILDVDTGIADVERDYRTEGSQTKYSVADEMKATEGQYWDTVLQDWLTQRGNTTQGLQTDVVTAGRSGVDAITNPSSTARSNVAGAAGGFSGEDTANAGWYEGNYAGNPPPAMGASPDAVTVASDPGGTGVDLAIAGAEAAAENLASTGGKDDDEEKR